MRNSGGQTVEWGYRGKHVEDITTGISVDDIGWLLACRSRTTDEEVPAGLRASGAAPTDVDIYTQAIRERITQLEGISEVPQAAALKVLWAPFQTGPSGVPKPNRYGALHDPTRPWLGTALPFEVGLSVFRHDGGDINEPCGAMATQSHP